MCNCQSLVKLFILESVTLLYILYFMSNSFIIKLTVHSINPFQGLLPYSISLSSKTAHIFTYMKFANSLTNNFFQYQVSKLIKN